ncbi:hypothetical protein [Escherichia phage UPEC06]|nr:hypothetical protein [Escherichia phage UPEC06]
MGCPVHPCVYRGAVEDRLISDLRITIVLLPRQSFTVYPLS